MKAIKIIYLLMLGLIACRSKPVGLENQPQMCFENDIQPIIAANCTYEGCHNAGHGAGGYDFTTKEGILKGIVANKPHQSPIYNSITNPLYIMPEKPYAPLSKEQRTKIFLWIEQGAKTSSCQ